MPDSRIGESGMDMSPPSMVKAELQLGCKSMSVLKVLRNSMMGSCVERYAHSAVLIRLELLRNGGGDESLADASYY